MEVGRIRTARARWTSLTGRPEGRVKQADGEFGSRVVVTDPRSARHTLTSRSVARCCAHGWMLNRIAAGKRACTRLEYASLRYTAISLATYCIVLRARGEERPTWIIHLAVSHAILRRWLRDSRRTPGCCAVSSNTNRENLQYQLARPHPPSVVCVAGSPPTQAHQGRIGGQAGVQLPVLSKHIHEPFPTHLRLVRLLGDYYPATERLRSAVE